MLEYNWSTSTGVAVFSIGASRVSAWVGTRTAFIGSVVLAAPSGTDAATGTIRAVRDALRAVPDAQALVGGADAEALAQVKSLGYAQAPVVVAGEDHWSGFRPDKIKALQAAVEAVAI